MKERFLESVEIVASPRRGVEIYYRIIFGNYKFEILRVFSVYV